MASNSGSSAPFDADVDALVPAQRHDAVVERPVEQPLELAFDAGPLDVAGDLGIERPGVLGREHERRPVEPAPPEVAREVEDLGARRLRDLDVAGPADPGDLVDHRGRIGDVLEHVRAHDVVEHAVGEGHVGGVGGEQRPGDPGGRAAGALPAVLGADVAVEQDVGSPVRLVAAADVEHEGVGTDRDGDAAAVERAEPAGQLRHSHGSWQMVVPDGQHASRAPGHRGDVDSSPPSTSTGR